MYPQSSYSYVDTGKKDNTFRGLAPPLGLLYIARVLEEDGDKVTLFDFSAENFEEQKIIKAMKKTDIVGITVLSFSLENVTKIIKTIRKTKPRIKVIIGGPHCTLFPEKALEETQADISIQGDGELVINDIKKAIREENNFSDIPGIYYREKNQMKKGGPLKLVENLDEIHFPARHLANKYNYGNQYNPKIKNGEFTSLITSRGCPYRCRFCSRNSVSMKKYRTRSTKNIIEELKEIKEEKYRYVAIMDDSFLSNKKQVHELFDEIIKQKLDLKFIITAARVDAADEMLFKKMKKAGVTHIQYGLESGNQNVLDFYNKKITVDRIQKAVNLSHKLGFFNMGSFILGAPFETRQHFEKTIKFAKKLPLDSVSFVTLKYMAGSELWYNAVKEGKITENNYLVQADSKKGLGTLTEEEILRYCKRARSEYYRRPTFILKLLKKSLKNDDMGFIQSYLSLFFSDIRDGLKFLGITPTGKTI
ncbi:MAG: radical SAM protein [Candidatus Thermoplasmatota archaeon]|nr:radical SAM protein [Candidatus Thermoplasmatota archaeon]